MSGETAGPRRVRERQAGEDPAVHRSRYPTSLHMVVEAEIEQAYADGAADGYVTGHSDGYQAGFAAGFAATDPPPVGTALYRAVERDAIREALWPMADTLAAAIAAHLRDLERAAGRRREHARLHADIDAWSQDNEHHRGDYGAPHTEQNVLGSEREPRPGGAS